MKLKLSLQRASGPTTDVVLITEPTAAVGDVAREIVEQDPLAAETMRAAAEVTLAVAPPGGGRPVVLPTERILGEAPVASGSVVSVVESVSGSRSTVVAATMRIEVQNANRRYSGRYGASLNQRFGMAPNQATNTKLISDVLSDALTRAFKDPAVAQMLAQ